MPHNFKFLISVDCIFKNQERCSSSTISHDCKEKKQFQKDLGIKRWRLWIRKGEGENNYCVQYIEFNQRIKFLDSFQQAIKSQNPYANWLDGLFKASLSLEYSLSRDFLEVQENSNEIMGDSPHEYFEMSYLLPLLERKMTVRKETYQYINQRDKKDVIQAYRSTKVNQPKRYIQMTSKGDLILMNTRHSSSLLEGRVGVISKKDMQHLLPKPIESQNFSCETLLPEADYIAIFGN